MPEKGRQFLWFARVIFRILTFELPQILFSKFSSTEADGKAVTSYDPISW